MVLQQSLCKVIMQYSIVHNIPAELTVLAFDLELLLKLESREREEKAHIAVKLLP